MCSVQIRLQRINFIVAHLAHQLGINFLHSLNHGMCFARPPITILAQGTLAAVVVDLLLVVRKVTRHKLTRVVVRVHHAIIIGDGLEIKCWQDFHITKHDMTYIVKNTYITVQLFV